MYSEDFFLWDVNVGSKVFVVFGFLWMYGWLKRVYWIDLVVIVEVGDCLVILFEFVDWIVGDEIVIILIIVEL